MFSCVGASGSHSEQPFSTGDSQDAPIGGERDPQLFFSGCRLNFHHHQQHQQQLLPLPLLLLTSQAAETGVMFGV